MYLGPIHTPEGLRCENMENFWQYSKVYESHVYSMLEVGRLDDPRLWEIKPDYYTWRDLGWAKKRADRYPMGKGARPMYSLFDGHKLDYVKARKVIYAPYYAALVIQTQSYKLLYDYVTGETYNDLVLRDFDGWDHEKEDMTLKEVINYPKKKMGHAFVLKMLLTGEIYECLK